VWIDALKSVQKT